MANRIKLDFKGFTAMRRSPEMSDAINAEAERIVARANAMGKANKAGQPHYSALHSQPTDIGQVALVATGTSLSKEGGDMAAIIDQAHHKTLDKALGGG